MNLLMLILIALGIIAAVVIFRFAWNLTSQGLPEKDESPGGKDKPADSSQ